LTFRAALEDSRSRRVLAFEPAYDRTPSSVLPDGWLTTEYGLGEIVVFDCLMTPAALPNHERRMGFSAEHRWRVVDPPVLGGLVTGPAGERTPLGMLARFFWWQAFSRASRPVDDQFGPRRIPAPPSRCTNIADILS
jgi:hypothetical protein